MFFFKGFIHLKEETLAIKFNWKTNEYINGAKNQKLKVIYSIIFQDTILLVSGYNKILIRNCAFLGLINAILVSNILDNNVYSITTSQIFNVGICT